MISSGQESVQVQANSHERDGQFALIVRSRVPRPRSRCRYSTDMLTFHSEHFSWRVELTDGDFDIKPNASWEGSDILRVAG